MAVRGKLSDLEEGVLLVWDELAFGDYRRGDSPRSHDDYVRRMGDLTPSYDEMLARSYVDGGWRVGSGVAYSVSVSRWFHAMTLQEYDRARLEITRLLDHPGPFHRSDREDLPIRLHLPRLVGFADPEAADALRLHIDCGVYRPGSVASTIAREIYAAGQPGRSDIPVPEAVRDLARALAAVRKSTKKVMRACDTIVTLADLYPLMAEVWRPRCRTSDVPGDAPA